MTQRENSSSSNRRGHARRSRLWVCLALVALVIVGAPTGFAYRLVQKHRLDARLIAAVKGNDARAVRALLAQGADAKAHDDGGRQLSLWTLLRDRLRGKPASALVGPTALAIAVGWQDGSDDYPPENPALVQALLDHGANPNDRGAQDLYGPGADPGTYTLATPGVYTLLQLAYVTGRRGTVSLLLNHGANVNAPNAGGTTIAMFAAGVDDPEMLQTFLRSGADIEAKDAQGQTALMWAAISNASHCIRILLDHHADRSIRDKQGRTALDWARKMGNTDAVRMLAKRP